MSFVNWLSLALQFPDMTYNSQERRPLVYLASPATADECGLHRLAGYAADAAALLMLKDYDVFSPVCHYHRIFAAHPGKDKSILRRGGLEMAVLGLCDAFAALDLPPWASAFEDESIRTEVWQAHALGLPLNLLTPRDGGLMVEAGIPAKLWAASGRRS